MITKDTLVFGSFSKKAGNVGCMFFNKYFQQYNIDAIYKSFSVENIRDAVSAAKTLRFSGFAVSMPYKSEILQYLDYIDPIVEKLQCCNTVVIKDFKFYGYNTDYISVLEYLKRSTDSIDILYILGNGAYSKTVQQCCLELSIKYTIITRENWSNIEALRNSYIFNSTPVDNIYIDPSNTFIDCIATTPTGAQLAKRQAIEQFKLYTGVDISE
jgi:shikimate dehydrogenase